MTALRVPFLLREAARGVVRYRLRSALALAGLAIGTGSVVATLALLDASRRLAMDGFLRISMLDVVRVTTPEETWKGGVRTRIAKRAQLLGEDVDRIREALPSLRAATVLVSSRSAVASGAAAVEAEVVAGRAELPGLVPITLLSGRFLTTADETGSARVAVLTPALALDLFAARSALGEEVRVKDQRFVVVGLAHVPARDDGEEPRTCWIPYRAGLERLGLPRDQVEVRLAAGTVAAVGALRAALPAVLDRLHVGVGAEGYAIEASDEELEAALRQEAMQASVLGGVALLAMTAAGAGILNTLLVGVRERTREIGTRRALGARRGAVLRQFLGEALLLALPGSLLGLGLGALVARLLGSVLAAGLEDPSALHVAVGGRESLAAAAAAVAIALAAGSYPAWEAARTPPSEALRYE